MAKKIIGLCTCPECAFDQAEVKATKAGLAYRWCPECNAQYFPRCKDTSDRLTAKCHTLAEEEEPVPPALEKTPAMAPAPVPVPVPEAKPAVKPKPAAKPGPFDFILIKGGVTA